MKKRTFIPVSIELKEEIRRLCIINETTYDKFIKELIKFYFGGVE